MLYVDYGASVMDALDGTLGRLLDLLRRYEQQSDPAKYFMARIRQIFCSSPADIRLIKRTLSLAKFAHKNQKRHTGEPYIIHPISAAVIIDEYLDIRDAVAISGALGHDIREDHEEVWVKWCVFWRIDKSVVNIVNWCNRNGYAGIKDKQKQDEVFLRGILYDAPEFARVVKSAEKLHNNITSTPWMLADAEWRSRKGRTIRTWYEPMTEKTGYLVDEMIASRIAVENGIRLITAP